MWWCPPDPQPEPFRLLPRFLRPPLLRRFFSRPCVTSTSTVPPPADLAAAAAWAAAHGNNQPQQPPERRGFWRPHAHVQQPPKNNYLAAGAPARPPQVEELHNKLKQFDEAGVMGAVYRGGACLFACGVLAFCSVAQPDRLTNAAYNLRYKETLGRILLCFAPSALLFLVVFSPKRATVGDAARAFHAAFFPCLLYTSPSPRDYAASRMPSSA